MGWRLDRGNFYSKWSLNCFISSQMLRSSNDAGFRIISIFSFLSHPTIRRYILTPYCIWSAELRLALASTVVLSCRYRLDLFSRTDWRLNYCWPRQHSGYWFMVLRDSWPYFTVSNSSLAHCLLYNSRLELAVFVLFIANDILPIHTFGSM